MSHFFKLIIAGVSSVRTKESIGGSTTSPSKFYFGIQRFNELTDAGIYQIEIERIDNDITTDNYSCFMPIDMSTRNDISSIKINTSLEAYKDDIYGLFMPRLVISNNENLHIFNFRHPDTGYNHTYVELLKAMVECLISNGFKAEIRTTTEIIAMIEGIDNASDDLIPV